MANQAALQALLITILGSNNVYFQPPTGKDILYPAIVYKYNGENPIYASNRLYNIQSQYTITTIDANPISLLPRKIAELPMSKYKTSFTKGNLNHYVYNLYF